MQIKELPKQIQKKVFEKQIEQGNIPNEEVNISESKGDGNFDWDETDEGYSFWFEVFQGRYYEFYEKYPKDKTPNWIKLSAIISIVFIIYIITCVLIELIN